MAKSRSTFTLVIIAVIFAGGVWLGTHLPGLSSSRKIYSSATLLQEIKPLAQLVTLQIVVQKYVEQVDSKWYGDNRVMLLAHGVVTAGIDLKKLEDKDIVVTGTNLVVYLPPSQIMDAHLDDKLTRLVENTTGVWRTPNKDMEQETRKIAVEDIRREARDIGILNKADEQARLLLANLFRQLGFTNVVFQSRLNLNLTPKPELSVAISRQSRASN